VSFVAYANFSLYENICLSYKTSLLACNCFQIGGGVDVSILWLSFAQQKLWPEVKKPYQNSLQTKVDFKITIEEAVNVLSKNCIVLVGGAMGREIESRHGIK
jgi:hypothetical protein